MPRQCLLLILQTALDRATVTHVQESVTLSSYLLKGYEKTTQKESQTEKSADI